MSDRDEPGMGEKIKGTTKEAVGDATGNEDMEREGEQQQKKAQKAEEAQRHEEAAEQKRNEESGHKGEQAARQD